MKLFDFNIHLPLINDDDVNVVIKNDLNLDAIALREGFEFHHPRIKNADKLNVMLFNTSLFDSGSSLHDVFPGISAEFTALIDFRRADSVGYIELAYASGVRAVMVNSYLQKISEQDFPSVLEACKFAERLGMIVCIDGSYGTSRMYDYDNMKLCCFISEAITKTPIVIVHSGGRRVLDAMLLALDKKNVWLDTSFSLPYYVGSSLEQDFAFAYKKIGCDRIVYGSDHPYVDFNESKKIHMNFFQKYHFDDGQVGNILYNNSQRLFKN